jgi:thiamine-monophosphate kinase
MGLQLLERENSVYYGQINDLRGKIKEAEKEKDAQKEHQLRADLSAMDGSNRTSPAKSI